MSNTEAQDEDENRTDDDIPVGLATVGGTVGPPIQAYVMPTSQGASPSTAPRPGVLRVVKGTAIGAEGCEVVRVRDTQRTDHVLASNAPCASRVGPDGNFAIVAETGDLIIALSTPRLRGTVTSNDTMKLS